MFILYHKRLKTCYIVVNVYNAVIIYSILYIKYHMMYNRLCEIVCDTCIPKYHILHHFYILRFRFDLNKPY